MRILDVNNNYSPTGGGVRTYHDAKLRWFREESAGDDYAFVVPSDRFDLSRDGRVSVYHVPAVPLGGSGYRFIVSPRQLARAVDDFAPDLVEVGSPYVLPALLRRTRAGRAAATVGFYHSDVADTVVRPLVRRLGFEEPGVAAASRHFGGVYAAMTATFGASEFVLEKLAAAGVTRLFHTPLGADVALYGPSFRSGDWRRSVGADDASVVCLFLSRLSREKGVDLLLDAWGPISEALAPRRARLVVAGHGPLQARVDAFAAARSDVTVLPYLASRADVATAYASADVFLSLGALETFSLSTLEALVSGAPVVAPDAGGAGEQVARLRPELRFAADRSESLAAACVAAANLTSGERAELASVARRAASWSRVFARHRELYERVHSAYTAQDLSALVAADGWHRAPLPSADGPP
ncbi:MAG: glycosyltransferase [Myxococcales bacterium]|nr:glycosyltransferase [Myxococcales bacterium]MCB9531330.1 glycosyltransferase [Myxococcales bacterium]